jgi:hypothetical protein
MASCFNCHLVSFFQPMSTTSASSVEHSNNKRGVEGVCTQFPPHIIGPLIAMFKYKFYLNVVDYKSEKVTAEQVADFLIEPIPSDRPNVKPMARLQYLLVMHIFASNGPVTFPTHRFDRQYREDILAGSTPTPSTTRNQENESLLAKIERKLSKPTLATPSSSQTHSVDIQPHASGQPPTHATESQPPPSQNPEFSFKQLEQDDPFFLPPPPSKSRNQRGNPLPPSQDPDFRFDFGSESRDDELSPPPSQAWPSQRSFPQFGSFTSSQPIIDSARSKSASFRFGMEPGPFKRPVVLPNSPNAIPGPSRRQAEASGLSKSTPSRSYRQMSSEILSRSTPGPSRYGAMRPRNDMDALSSTPQTQIYSHVAGTPSPSTAFRTPGIPASSVPVTPTRTSRSGMTPSPLSANSPLATFPIIPPSTLRYNPYPPPPNLYRDGSRKGNVPGSKAKGTPKTRDD